MSTVAYTTMAIKHVNIYIAHLTVDMSTYNGKWEEKVFVVNTQVAVRVIESDI